MAASRVNSNAACLEQSLHEMTTFPFSRNDDQVDSASQDLQSIYISPALLDQMKDHLKSMNRAKAECANSEFDALSSEIKEIERKKEKLFNMMFEDNVQNYPRYVQQKDAVVTATAT